MTLVLFIFVNLVFFCPKMILCIKIEISRNDFYVALIFTFIIKIRFPKEVSIATILKIRIKAVSIVKVNNIYFHNAHRTSYYEVNIYKCCLFLFSVIIK